MNRYETIFILEPDIPDVEREPVFDKIRLMISQQNGTLLMFDDWGNRKLAYSINKKMHGRYIRLDYCGIATLVGDLERLFRLDHRVLKYMTILLEKDVDPEALKEALKTEEPKPTEKAEPIQSDKPAEADTPSPGQDEISESEPAQPESTASEKEE